MSYLLSKEDALSKLSKQPLSVAKYDDHLSLIYPKYIFKIFVERIQIIVISGEDIEYEYIKIGDFDYLNTVLEDG